MNLQQFIFTSLDDKNQFALKSVLKVEIEFFSQYFYKKFQSWNSNQNKEKI